MSNPNTFKERELSRLVATGIKRGWITPPPKYQRDPIKARRAKWSAQSRERRLREKGIIQ